MFRKFKKCFSVFMATLIFVNFFVPSIAFAGTDEVILEEIQQTKQIQLVEEPIEEETINPEITSLSIESNNKNKDWAKTGDIITIKFVTTTKDSNLTVTVNSKPAVINSTDVLSYVANYIVTDNDADGLATFDIVYNNVSNTVTKDGSSVEIDNTTPIITTYSEYQTTDKLKKSISSLESQTLVDDGVFVDESTGEVVLKTTWSVPTKNLDGSYTYNVTYTAEDNSGNVSEEINVIINLETDIVDARISSTVLEIELLGDAITRTELGNVFEDFGAKYTWDGESPVYAWVTGDLNTVVSRDDYSLTYNGMIETEYATLESENSLIQTNTTRTIKVSDTVAPGPVKDFYLVSGNGYIDLHWINPLDKDFAGVQIWRSTIEGQLGEMILFTSKTTVSFEDTNVLNGITYYYTLVAVDLSANSSTRTNQLFATPLAPQIVSNDTSFGYDAYSYQEVIDEKDGEVKSGTQDKEDNKQEEDKGILPLLGLLALLVLLATGLYLLYLQNPGWFSWLFFWKKNKNISKK